MCCCVLTEEWFNSFILLRMLALTVYNKSAACLASRKIRLLNFFQATTIYRTYAPQLFNFLIFCWLFERTADMSSQSMQSRAALKTVNYAP